MSFSNRAALVLLASWAIAAPVQAAAPATDAVEAGLTWRLAFGAHTAEAGYDLTLGYRSAEHFAPLSKVLALRVDGASADATLAGIPLTARAYQSDETGQSAAIQPADTPWYAHSWVLWTVGGLAATAALAGSGGGNVSYHGESNSTHTSSNDSGLGCTNSNVGDQQVDQCAVPPGTHGPCAGNVCTVSDCGVVTGPCPGGFTASRHFLFGSRELEAWLDEGTGGMGDLIAR